MSWAYWAPKSTTSTGWCSLMSGLQGLGAGLESLDLRGRETVVVTLDWERNSGNYATRCDDQEARERPAHEAPQAEVTEQVEHVEPAVQHEDRRRQVDAGDLLLGGQREKAERAEQLDVDTEAVAKDHHEREKQQEGSRD